MLKFFLQKFKYKQIESISTENSATNENTKIIKKPPTPNVVTPHLSSETESKPTPRVLSRSTKNVPLRFNPSINVLVLVTVLLCVLASALGQDVIHLSTYGAVAEKCGKVAIDQGPALFSMILQMEIPSIEKTGKLCTESIHADKTLALFAELDKNSQQPVWMNYANMSRSLKATTDNNSKRKPRFIPLFY